MKLVINIRHLPFKERVHLIKNYGGDSNHLIHLYLNGQKTFLAADAFNFLSDVTRVEVSTEPFANCKKVFRTDEPCGDGWYWQYKTTKFWLCNPELRNWLQLSLFPAQLYIKLGRKSRAIGPGLKMPIIK